MKSKILKQAPIVCIAVFLLAHDAAAQRRPSRQPRPTVPNQQVQTNSQPGGYDPYAGIPIIIDSSSLVDTSARKSQRPTSPFGKENNGDGTILVYESLRQDDALYAQKVWREIDFKEKMNQVFNYNATEDNGSQLFINILLSAVKSGRVAAFEDDRFSIPVTPGQVAELTQGRIDTIPKYKANKIEEIEALIVTRASFDPRVVAKLRIMEEWVFDRESSRMVCRILGIAPLKKEYLPNGQERGSSVMFWVHYPELRPELVKYKVYNPKNMGQSRMTWEELFESRMFASYITKSTIDNATNRTIRSSIKDPVLALLEGDNVREKIFNYEQDLWSY